MKANYNINNQNDIYISIGDNDQFEKNIQNFTIRTTTVMLAGLTMIALSTNSVNKGLSIAKDKIIRVAQSGELMEEVNMYHKMKVGGTLTFNKNLKVDAFKEYSSKVSEELLSLEERVKYLVDNSATKADLETFKSDLVEKTVGKTDLETFKSDLLEKLVTKEELINVEINLSNSISRSHTKLVLWIVGGLLTALATLVGFFIVNPRVGIKILELLV